MSDRTPVKSFGSPSDERRQEFRADVHMCLAVDMPITVSCQSVPPQSAQRSEWRWDDLAVSPDLVKGMLLQTELATQEPLLLQLLVRVDWMLTSVMKTLGKETCVPQALPEFVTANLSGSGIRFPSRKEFHVGDDVDLRIVLRPFVPIQVIAKVLRIRAVTVDGQDRWETACEFTDIMSDDQDAIIRHVLRSQAALQRRRSAQMAGPLVR